MGRHQSRHRVPPKPEHYASMKPGRCRMCGDPVMEGGVVNNRKRWHPNCLARWKIMNQPAETRRYLFRRDKGACACCGLITPRWQADHIVPLRHAYSPEHWTLTNLQTLCQPCHVKKTNADRVLYADENNCNKLHDDC